MEKMMDFFFFFRKYIYIYFLFIYEGYFIHGVH
jgi:hypothetical protein